MYPGVQDNLNTSSMWDQLWKLPYNWVILVTCGGRWKTHPLKNSKASKGYATVIWLQNWSSRVGATNENLS